MSGGSSFTEPDKSSDKTAITVDDVMTNYHWVDGNWVQNGYGNNYGWICPKCGIVHAPWVAQCTCNQIQYTYTDGTTGSGWMPTPVKGEF